MRKSFYNNIKVVLCNKYARKSTKYSRNETILKISHVAKARAHAKAFCKMVSVGQEIKMPNTCKKQFCKNITVVLRINPLGITANIQEMRQFWKSAKAIAHAKAIDFCKVYSLCMGYSLCKVADFQNCPISRTTLMFFQNCFSHVFGIFFFWPTLTILHRTTLMFL